MNVVALGLLVTPAISSPINSLAETNSSRIAVSPREAGVIGIYDWKNSEGSVIATASLATDGTLTVTNQAGRGDDQWPHWNNPKPLSQVNENFGALVKKIVFEGATVKVDGSAYNMFANLPMLEAITNIEKLNTANVTNMGYMFYGSTSLTSLNLNSVNSNFKTSSVTNMNHMFSNTGLKELVLKFTTSCN